MAVASTDFLFYLAASRPEADTGTSGGAIALVRVIDRTVCDALNGGAGEKIKVVSAGAGDTAQTIALAGYGTDGAWLEETLALAGTTPVISVNTYLHLKKGVLSATCAGALTVTGNTSTTALFVGGVPAGSLGQSTMFLKASANAVGGAEKKIYEKCFLKNTHATDAGVAILFYNALDNKTQLAFSLEKVSNVQATGGSETTAARTTVPAAGGNTYVWTDMLLVANGVLVGDAADGNLVAAEAQGIWVCLTLAAGTAPDKVAQMTLGCLPNAA
jgi:hypothetical protein